MAQISMRRMKVNQKGVVRKINVSGEMGKRIREMGLVPGVPIMVIGRAPLYDPVAIKVRDYTLTLRNNEADCIEVDVDVEPEA